MTNVILQPGAWILSEAFSEDYFKITHDYNLANPTYYYRGTLAQAAYFDKEFAIYAPQNFAAKLDTEILYLPKLVFLETRMLAFKALIPPDNTFWNWSLSIMPLSGTSTPTPTFTPASGANLSHVSVGTTAVQLIAANTITGSGSRKGLSIKNNSTTANLIIGKDNTVSGTGVDFIEKIPPGLTYEFPVCYTGVIFGICDAASTGTATVVEFIQ